MAASEGDINLVGLFSRALKNSSKVVNLPSIEDETQVSLSSVTSRHSVLTWVALDYLDIQYLGRYSYYYKSSFNHREQTVLSDVLSDLQTLTSRINTLGLFSSNETFDEISTRNAIFMFVPYVLGDMQLRLRTTESEERMEVVKKAAVGVWCLWWD